MRVSVITLGCRVNQAESDSLETMLQGRGAIIVNLTENPDYCVINTCTVTAESDQNSRQLIRRAARAGARVVVTGCYSQVRSEDVRSIPGVVQVFDNARKDDIAGFICPDAGPGASAGLPERSRPYIKVQDGCDFRCSYCAVRLARGRSRSMPKAAVIERARQLDEAGFSEIVLTGVHLGTYGRDLARKSGLVDLLSDILEATSRCRVRLSSLEINEIDDELLGLMRSGRVCDHLHIPMQSGSDRVLSLMRRNYSSSAFRHRVERILAILPDMALGSDIMVGFPGESEEDHGATVEAIRDMPFAYLHVFPYSMRGGTEASVMADQVSVAEKRKRMDEMKQVCSEKRIAYMRRQIGRELGVVIEDLASSGEAVGTSNNFLKVRVRGEGLRRGSLAAVRPAAIVSGRLHGVLIPAR